MVIGGFDITENKIRARQIDPDRFEKGSFKTIRLASGVKAIVGRLKGEESTTIQSILFDKNRFDEEKADAWLKRNQSKFSDAVVMEEEKVKMFDMDMEEHLDGHLPPLTRNQIMRLLELAGPADDEEDMAHHDEEKYVSNFVKRL